jgi:hypothetical protein
MPEKPNTAATLSKGDQPARPGTVPPGKTYIRLDAKKREVARYSSGQSMKAMDCVKIPCPSGFGKDDVCWDCGPWKDGKPQPAVLQR